jgi:hypothetical protein
MNQKAMNKTIAIARAKFMWGQYDLINKWALELEEYAKNLGYNVIDISGSDLTYERITEILTQTKPSILFNFTLGTKECLIGDFIDGGPIKCALTPGNSRPSNLGVLKSMAVVAYSCYSAGRLGEKMIQAVCLVVVGFSEEVIVMSPFPESNAHEIHKECLLSLAKRILEGYTIGKAIDATRKQLLDAMEDNIHDTDLCEALVFNKRSLRMLGDYSWKLEPPIVDDKRGVKNMKQISKAIGLLVVFALLVTAASATAQAKPELSTDKI